MRIPCRHRSPAHHADPHVRSATGGEGASRRVSVSTLQERDNGEPLAQRATTTIPIITMSRDPVAEGLVASVGRPGGNITGVRLPLAEQAAKRLQREKIYLKWCSTGDSEET